MFCNKCGAEIKDDAKFCPYCGDSNDGDEKTIQLLKKEAVSPSYYNEAANTAPQKRKKPVVGIIIGVLVAVLALGLIVTLLIVGLIAAGIGGASFLSFKNDKGEKIELEEDDDMFEIEPYETKEYKAPETEYEPIVETEAIETVAPPEESDPLKYFVENCDSMYFTSDYIKQFDEVDCRCARNAPYARHGRIFQTDSLTEYFMQFDWYNPRIHPDYFNESVLNAYELSNRDLIIEYEKQMKYNNYR
ncbi:MAG: YARHG domain-containing protein [Clostridia bacterium]|nr:YARHG domain-containing protein [Clostridia bacterium]